MSDETLIVAQMKRSGRWTFALSLLFWIASAGFAILAAVDLASSQRDGAARDVRIAGLVWGALAFACASPALLLHRYARSVSGTWLGAWQVSLSRALVNQNRLLRLLVGIVVVCACSLLLALLRDVIAAVLEGRLP